MERKWDYRKYTSVARYFFFLSSHRLTKGERSQNFFLPNSQKNTPLRMGRATKSSASHLRIKSIVQSSIVGSSTVDSSIESESEEEITLNPEFEFSSFDFVDQDPTQIIHSKDVPSSSDLELENESDWGSSSSSLYDSSSDCNDNDMKEEDEDESDDESIDPKTLNQETVQDQGNHNSDLEEVNSDESLDSDDELVEDQGDTIRDKLIIKVSDKLFI